MSKALIKTSVPEPKIDESIPAGLRLAALLGIGLNEALVVKLMRNPGVAFCDPRAMVVSQIIQHVRSIATDAAHGFYLNTDWLKDEVVMLDYQNNRNFFYESMLLQGGGYWVPQPITERSGLPQFLAPLGHLKTQGAQFPHAPMLFAALLFATARRICMACQGVVVNLDGLFLMLIEVLEAKDRDLFIFRAGHIPSKRKYCSSSMSRGRK